MSTRLSQRALPASPHQAQGVVNVAPGEGAPKQVTYDELTNQVVKLMDQVKTAGSDAEIEALNKKVAEIEAEVAKRATKTALTRSARVLSIFVQDNSCTQNMLKDIKLHVCLDARSLVKKCVCPPLQLTNAY